MSAAEALTASEQGSAQFMAQIVAVGTRTARHDLRLRKYIYLSPSDARSARHCSVQDVRRLQGHLRNNWADVTADAQDGMSRFGDSLARRHLIQVLGVIEFDRILSTATDAMREEAAREPSVQGESLRRRIDALQSFSYIGDLWPTAIHEAAHASVARSLGCPASWFLAWDERELTLCGKCITSDLPDRGPERRQIGLAGKVAEALLAYPEIGAEEIFDRIRLPRASPLKDRK